MYSKVANADITPGYKTDHSMITLGLTIQSNPKGPGLWKLNTSFLSEIEYVNKMKLIINETTQQYKDDNEVDDSLLWEMIKLKIWELSIKYGSYKKKQQKTRQMLLEDEIALLEKESEKPNDPKKEEVLSRLVNAKRELEEIIEYRTKGSIVRSKAKWYNDGEKNTKYFLQLEKRHYKRKNISTLKRNDNSVVTSDPEILNECVKFYRELYSSKLGNIPQSKLDELTDEFFPADNEIRISREPSESCEGPLTTEECLVALKAMESGKSPGSDGFPIEF